VGYDEDLNCLATQNDSSQLLQNVCNYLHNQHGQIFKKTDFQLRLVLFWDITQHVVVILY